MRGAFTLIEMLVAVALVLLMMTLFATIFQMATGAMSTQKGLAENDQRVRLVLSRLRNDLNGKKQGQDANDPNRPYRTFGWVVPWGPDENTGSSITIGTTTYTSTDRRGYFFISENDPNDDTDDVLGLTVQFPSGASDQFFGRAAVVFADGAGNYGPVGSSPTPGSAPYPPAAPAAVSFASNPGPGQQYWLNQPEFDDVQGTPNGVGNSQYAEVCYFLRKGTLYRRVLLVRQPNFTTPPLANDGNPTNNSLLALNMAGVYGGPAVANANTARSFWTDFDYAAIFNSHPGTYLTTLPPPTPAMEFHGTGSTIAPGCDSLSAAAAGTNPFTLGNPGCRFGFDSSTNTVVNGVNTSFVPTLTYGQPREYITTPNGATPANTTFFIGRFTHGETSFAASPSNMFGYPGNLNTNPMSLATTLNFNTATGVVGNFTGPRAGEDALMTNVLKFDIKVFDPAASVGPDGAPGVAGVDDDGDGHADFLANGNIDLKELGWVGSDDGDFRDIGHNGTTGFYNQNPRNVPVTMIYKNFPPTGTYNKFSPAGSAYYTYPNLNYSNPNGSQGALGTFKNRFDTWNPSLSLTNTTDGAGNQIHECPPFRPFNFGGDGAPGIKGVDDDGNGFVDYLANGDYDPMELGYPTVTGNAADQPIPLSAIQIKITFYDRTSNQVRETTLVQSLSYKP